MPPYPIEILSFGDASFKLHETVMDELNSLQKEVVFLLPREPYRNWAARIEREAYSTQFVWNTLEEYRAYCKGFRPFVIGIVHGSLASPKLSNLFGSHEAERGLAAVTTKDWEALFAPPPLTVYLAYYFVRYTLSFVCPEIKSHEDTPSCLFHRKLEKARIKESMLSGKICDACRELFDKRVDAFTYESLRKLVAHVRDRAAGTQEVPRKPKVFIGSSAEGHSLAELIQLGLQYDAECTVWSQGVFGLSTGTLEALARKCTEFDYAILVLTPDDLATKRGEKGNSPRDNVLFELGLFMGALGRQRTFMVRNRDIPMELPTDLADVTPATFGNRADGNLQAALGPVCTQIKIAMGVR